MTRVCAVMLLIGLSACAHVPRYRRETLAHHSLRESDYAGGAEQHVRAVQEGPLVGGVSAADGCGCN